MVSPRTRKVPREKSGVRLYCKATRSAIELALFDLAALLQREKVIAE